MKRISSIFLQGLVAVLPIAVTVYILYWLASTAESALGGVIKRIISERYYTSGMGVAAGVVIIFAIGVLLHAWFIRSLFGWGERILERIPLVKTLYGSVRDLMGFFSVSKRGQFNQVAMVKFPDGNTKLIGLITRQDFRDLPAGVGGQDQVVVYLPMSYQMGGFAVVVPRSQVEPIDMTIEQAMRFAVTAGMSTGKDEPPARSH